MTKEKEPSEQRLLQIKIGEVKPKTGTNGPFIGIQLAGSTKWYNCFQVPEKVPEEGEIWWANIKTSGQYENLVDMIHDMDYTGPRSTEEQTKEPAQGQQKITEEKVVNPPKKATPAKQAAQSSEGNIEIPQRYIVKIGDKEFIKYQGLLDIAHNKGLKQIETIQQEVDFDNGSAWCWVRVLFVNPEGIQTSFDGTGSGTQENCGSMVKKHYVEMSQTRAMARALRFALNIDMVALDELTDPFKKKES